jgi:predicted ferric reductase
VKPSIHLFDSPATLSQQLLLLLWGGLLVGVVAIWAPIGTSLLSSGTDGIFLAVAQLMGLLATFFALTQFLLMGRIVWIEHTFGLDRLAHYHRLNGYLAITLILLHPLFITLYHLMEGEPSIWSAFVGIFAEHPYTLLALVSEILFITVVISSIYIARKHLKFETWYFVHMLTYSAIILASFHQFVNGSSLVSSQVAYNAWLGLYAFVALNLMIWRFGLPLYNFMKFDFRIVRVAKETPTVTSIYIKALGVERLKIKPGQFVMVRIFTRQLWWQEHPFTVSWIPKNDELRISVRNVGDYTAELQNLTPGARVLISGPFGRFTSDIATTKRRLFIAGGIGITPLRSLAEEAVDSGVNAVLLYANRNTADVPLKQEIDALGLPTIYVYSDEKVDGVAPGFINGDMIAESVPDFVNRDIYLCGPPAMMAALVDQLTALGVSSGQIHYELFALHN